MAVGDVVVVATGAGSGLTGGRVVPITSDSGSAVAAGNVVAAASSSGAEVTEAVVGDGVETGSGCGVGELHANADAAKVKTTKKDRTRLANSEVRAS